MFNIYFQYLDTSFNIYFQFSDISEWTSDHIAIWLRAVGKMFNIEEMPSVQRFPRTGKELPVMEMEAISEYNWLANGLPYAMDTNL